MDYQERGEIGRGGMAVVYLADGPSGQVALKRPLPWDGCKERLTREISVLTSLDHPNVMPVLDHDMDDAGEPWYAMPLSRGSLIKLGEAGDLGTDAEAVCRSVLEDVCAGLGAMHEVGLVHRDVSPNNVLALEDPTRTAGFRWAIADCGIVRRPAGDTTEGLTGSASQIGTRGYVAPESYGDPSAVTMAADVYALGRIFARLLTGERPVLTVPLLPDGDWRSVVRAFTHNDPTRRPQTATKALSRAEDLLAALPTSEKTDFRAQIRQHGGKLRPDNPLWNTVRDNLDDVDFMLDDLPSVELSAASNLARADPESGAAIGEGLALHLANGDWGRRSFDAANHRLDWIKACMEGLIRASRLDLLGDVAAAYCEAVAMWDRYDHNDRLRAWLSAMADPAGTEMARAIRAAGTTDYFKGLMEGRSFVSTSLAALLQR